jgi:hypothetical protein
LQLPEATAQLRFFFFCLLDSRLNIFLAHFNR